MKIIFDSEEQKRDFMMKISSTVCPMYVAGLDKKMADDDVCTRYSTCMDCWADAVEMEVK